MRIVVSRTRENVVSHSSTRRSRRAVAAIGAVSAALIGVTGAAHAAAPPVANLQVKVLKISGLTLGSAATIPSGTSLQVVTMTTLDPDSGPQGPLGLNPDPFSLVRGEAMTVTINGVTVAAKFPDLRAVALPTNTGTSTYLVFSAGGNSYALPKLNQNLSGITKTIATSKLNLYPVPSVITYEYGVLPEAALVFSGKVYTQGPAGGSLGDYLVYDADRIRGSGDSAGDEVILQDLHGAITYSYVDTVRFPASPGVLATLQFTDGTIQAVRGIAVSQSCAYCDTVTRYLFDSAALASSGHTVSSIASVISSAPSANSLNWEQLGFTIA